MHYAARLFEVRPSRPFPSPFLPFRFTPSLLLLRRFYALLAATKRYSRDSEDPESRISRDTKGSVSRRSGLIIRSREAGRGTNNARSLAHLRFRLVKGWKSHYFNRR